MLIFPPMDLPGAIVAALSYPAQVIGRDGKLPWTLPLELRLFRQLTWGGILVMGRRTWESLNKPLPGREMWVWSERLAAATIPTSPTKSKDNAPVRFFSSEAALVEALTAADRPVFYVAEPNSLHGHCFGCVACTLLGFGGIFRDRLTFPHLTQKPGRQWLGNTSLSGVCPSCGYTTSGANYAVLSLGAAAYRASLGSRSSPAVS